MNIFQQTFTVQSVATAAGCEAKQISDWCNMGRVVGQREPTGRGRSRQFSWFNVMEIAIATELMNIGVKSPQDAFKAAQHFSHVGDSAATWIHDDAISEDDEPSRYPALPYHHDLGATFLFLSGSKSNIVLSKDGTVNLFTIAPPYSRARGYILVNVTEICASVLHRLGYDYRVILDEAYAKKKAD